MREILLRDLKARITMLGGQCPVQAEGTVGSKRFYFRSRWEQWSLHIGDDPIYNPEFVYGEPWGKTPGDAGYMPEDEAIAMIARGLDAYKTWEGNGVREGDT